MATTKDSNKLTIYKGSDTDYAFIPLTVTEDSSYEYTNNVIRNDGRNYIKKITTGDIYKLINDNIIDKDAINANTIGIDTDTKYYIKGYLTNDMLTHNIKLYYIENFKYTLDASQYVIENETNSTVESRKDTYMFTIKPLKFRYDIEDIDKSDTLPPDTGGGSGGGSGETTDPNKKYNIIFSVDQNQSLSLKRIGLTNTYKLTGTLDIKYRQSDNSIKGDKGTQIPLSYNNPTFSININNNDKSFSLSKKIDNGYNETTQQWEGRITLDINTYELKYELTPGKKYIPSISMNLNKDHVSYFTYRGTRLDNYIGEDYVDVNTQKYYTFKLKEIKAETKTTLNAYFLQSKLGSYNSWNSTVIAVKDNKLNTNEKSGIFILVTEPGFQLNNSNVLDDITTSIQTLICPYSNQFPFNQKGHNTIFTSTTINNGTVVLDGPPIFLYDENGKQTKIIDVSTDNNIFNDESYFTYKSGNKFTVGTERKKNIINLNKYKYLMYKLNSGNIHNLGTNLTNEDLSKYVGWTFNVVYEVWLSRKNLQINPDTQINTNTPLKMHENTLLSAVNPNSQLNNKLDRWDIDGGGGGTTIKPINNTYKETLTQYKLYSFKLSKTDSTTGVYEYTID